MNDTSRQGSSIQYQKVLEILCQILVSVYRYINLYIYKPLETEAKSLSKNNQSILTFERKHCNHQYCLFQVWMERRKVIFLCESQVFHIVSARAGHVHNVSHIHFKMQFPNYITLLQTSYIKRTSCEKEVTTLPPHTQRALPDIKDKEYKLFSYHLCKGKNQVSSTVNIILWSSGLQTSRVLKRMLDKILSCVLVIYIVTSHTIF